MRLLRDISRNSSPCNPGSTTIRQFTQELRHFTPDPPQFYSADTQTSTLGRRLSNHNVLWKQKILKFFCKRTNKMQGSTMQSLKTLKPFEVTSTRRKQTSNLWMLLVRLQKKNLRIFLFFHTVRRQPFCPHFTSSFIHNLLPFIHFADPILLVDSREVTREPHAKGEMGARVESSLAGYTTVRYFLFIRPI